MPELQTVRPAQIRIGVTDVRAAASFYTKAFDVVFNEAIDSIIVGNDHSAWFCSLSWVNQPPTWPAVATPTSDCR